MVRGHRWQHGALPPQAQVHSLFSKQHLDQCQVQTGDAPTIQDQDLIARTQTCSHGQTRFRKATPILNVTLLLVISRSAPSLKARPSGSTSLTKTLLFFWLSAYPVTAKPARRIQPEDYIKDHDINYKHDSPKRARLTEVAAAALPAHVQRKHISRDHLQLIIDLRGNIKQIDTHYRKSG